jgi:hypothetical protein
MIDIMRCGRCGTLVNVSVSRQRRFPPKNPGCDKCGHMTLFPHGRLYPWEWLKAWRMNRFNQAEKQRIEASG